MLVGMWKKLIYVHTNQIQTKLDFYRWNIRVIFYWNGRIVECSWVCAQPNQAKEWQIETISSTVRQSGSLLTSMVDKNKWSFKSIREISHQKRYQKLLSKVLSTSFVRKKNCNFLFIVDFPEIFQKASIQIVQHFFDVKLRVWRCFAIRFSLTSFSDKDQGDAIA